jgi:hypothetical protein
MQRQRGLNTEAQRGHRDTQREKLLQRGREAEEQRKL